MKLTSKSPEETRDAARLLLSNLKPREGATVLALEGELGAGKTNLAQALGELIGVTENMHSPTFVIEKIYDIDFQGFKELVHIDAYRIEKDEELVHLGWNEIIKEPTNLILIEWPENVSGLIPEGAVRVTLKVVDENTREIEIHGR
jgi:tRNA threonylcarbamoyladenosine biosynthesis protein TsaE